MGNIFRFGVAITLNIAWLVTTALTSQAQTSVNIDTVAYTGLAAPGTNATFSEASRVNLNDAGQTGFIGFLTPVDPATGSAWSIWTGVPNNLTLVTRGGQAAPGTPAGTLFYTFQAPLFSESGETAFNAELRSPGSGAVTTANDRGLWAGPPGNLRLIAREGDPTPGISGATFLEGLTLVPSLSASGRVAFFSRVQFASSIGSGVWVGASYATLAHIAHTGEITPVGGTFGGSAPPSVNDSGDLVFNSSFSSSGSALWKWIGSSLAVVARTGVSTVALGGPGGTVQFTGFTEFPVLNGGGTVAFSAKLDDVAGTKVLSFFPARRRQPS